MERGFHNWRRRMGGGGILEIGGGVDPVVRLWLIMFYVYCLQSEKEKEELYFGFSNNLKARLGEHNSGHNFSTKRYMPWKLIYYEACLLESDARRRERYLKTNIGRRMFKKRLKDYMKVVP